MLEGQHADVIKNRDAIHTRLLTGVHTVLPGSRLFLPHNPKANQSPKSNVPPGSCVKGVYFIGVHFIFYNLSFILYIVIYCLFYIVYSTSSFTTLRVQPGMSPNTQHAHR